ncbi:PAS domain-containing protein [Arenimonas sp.]|uniref:PAS domain-containing protein n=1 Tax=Arenimonas sp. TaxID=1872635 RepID=UPI0025B7ED0A|nr:PAS domain-containing protein [Arenimonas sp.]
MRNAPPITPITPQHLADLRLRAASRLGGIVGAQGEPVSASGALAVLHDLAASPETAADALALLHELQVHQVEVDLQAEALSESRAELETALQRQIDRYDALPVGCFTVDRALVVHDLNRTGATMLGVGRDEAIGQALDAYLTPECQRAVRQGLTHTAEGKAVALPTLHLIAKEGVQHLVQAHIAAEPAAAGQQFLLVLSRAGDAVAGGRVR